MELQLASKLGVSRTPIREAIRMLEQEGLAVTIPRKGAEVAKMTEKDMEDVLEIRSFHWKDWQSVFPVKRSHRQHCRN